MAPHVLHMTATPIPRTLSLTAYGDLDTTALHELPAGRQPVETRLVEEDERAGAYEFLRERLREGRQAFVVCPLVAESEKLQGKAAEVEAERLARGRAARLRGRRPPRPDALGREGGGDGGLRRRRDRRAGRDDGDRGRDRRRQRDRDGDRGRRALRRLPAAPAARPGRPRRARVPLPALRRRGRASWRGGGCRRWPSERDGFKLAEVDLGLRGEGEILGTRQHGLPRFAVAELPEDTPLLIAARDEVLALLRRHGSPRRPRRSARCSTPPAAASAPAPPTRSRSDGA